MNSIKKVFWSLSTVFGFIFLGACSKMDEFKKYIDEKGTFYPTKIDSLVVLSGRERVVIRSRQIIDPTIAGVTIYWNNRTDSVRVNLGSANGVRRLNESLALPEGPHYFDLFTYDGFGSRSVPVSSLGVSYGELYQNSLIPRTAESAEVVNDSLIIRWDFAIHASRGVRLTYGSADGITHTQWVSNEADTTIVKPYWEGVKLGIQTWFLPDSNCVDTFFTPRQMLDVDQLLSNGQQGENEAI